MNSYKKRIVDEQLAFYLETFGAVLVRGPKWCGKTTTAEQQAKSVLKMQDNRHAKDYLLAAETDVSLILQGERPHLIDEWQVAPVIWDAVRTSVDEEGVEGMYILTGSRVPAEDSYRHSGAGRIGTLFMYPMSLMESGEATGEISLRRLFDGNQTFEGQQSNLSIQGLAESLCRGGWPANLGLEYRKAALKLRSYLDLIYESDDLSLKKYAKNIEVARLIVKSYSRNVSSLTDLKTIYKDVVKNDLSISESQFFDYISALQNVYLIEDVPAWSPAIRSKTAIRSMSKKELIDPSIAALSLGITPSNFMDDFETFGFLFENLCMRDLRVYASALNGSIHYYRDRYGLEADAVIRLEDGRYALVEIKLGEKGVEEGARHLCELEKLLVEKDYASPVFKMILTGGKLAYTRKDGVKVVPIGCLGV